MPKKDKEEKKKRKPTVKANKPVKAEKTLLERGLEMNKKYNIEQNKTVYDVYREIEKKKEKEDSWFEERLKKIRDETRQALLDDDAYAKKYLTKNQAKSEIIGAKEYVRDVAPDKMKVYTHYARKYGIPYMSGTMKKSLADLVRDIHTYEMKHRDDIINKKVLDPVTKTYGLYIV